MTDNTCQCSCHGMAQYFHPIFGAMRFFDCLDPHGSRSECINKKEEK